MIVKGKDQHIVLLTNSYVIYVKTLTNFSNTSFSQVLKEVRKMAISSTFEGFESPLELFLG